MESKSYELKIEILNKDYVNQLIIALVRQGFDVYLNEDENVLCFTVSGEDLIEVKYERIKKGF